MKIDNEKTLFCTWREKKLHTQSLKPEVPTICMFHLFLNFYLLIFMVRNSVEVLGRCRSSAEQGWQDSSKWHRKGWGILCLVFYDSVLMGKCPVPKYPPEIKNEKANNRIISRRKKFLKIKIELIIAYLTTSHIAFWDKPIHVGLLYVEWVLLIIPWLQLSLSWCNSVTGALHW